MKGTELSFRIPTVIMFVEIRIHIGWVEYFGKTDDPSKDGSPIGIE